MELTFEESWHLLSLSANTVSNKYAIQVQYISYMHTYYAILVLGFHTDETIQIHVHVESIF